MPGTDILPKRVAHASTSTNRNRVTPELQDACREVLIEKEQIREEIRRVQADLEKEEMLTQKLLQQNVNSIDPFVQEQLANRGMSVTRPTVPTQPIVQHLSEIASPDSTTSYTSIRASIPSGSFEFLKDNLPGSETSLDEPTPLMIPTLPAAPAHSALKGMPPHTPAQPTQTPEVLEEQTSMRSDDRPVIPGTLPVVIATNRGGTLFNQAKPEISYDPKRKPVPIVLASNVIDDVYTPKQVASDDYPNTPPPSMVFPEQQQYDLGSMGSSVSLKRELQMEIAAMHAAIQQRVCMASAFILLLLILFIFY